MDQSIKPYIDRLVTLKHLLNPVDRIIEKREQIEKLQSGLATDLAKIEDLSKVVSVELDTVLLNELQGELGKIKKDRKILVGEIATEEEEASSKPASKGIPHWRPGKPRWPGVLPTIVFAA